MSHAIPASLHPSYDAGDRFLIFAERGARYALPADLVREALLLPRLTVLEETPPWVVGAFERRGALVPVISPALALHHQPAPAARASDFGILVDREGYLIAMHADAVLELVSAQRVLPIPPDRLDALHGSDRPASSLAGAHNGDRERLPAAPTPAAPIIEYEIALEDGMVPVLETNAIRLHALTAGDVDDLPERRLKTFERELGAAEKDRLSARTLDYSRVRRPERQRGLEAFVVFELAGERFAFPATESVELSKIGRLFPVPGAPSHILGFAPLRGEVVTLVDVRGPLGLSRRGLWEPPLMIVMYLDGHRTGIAIDRALGLIRTDLRPVGELPLKLGHTGARWLQGCARSPLHAPDDTAGRTDAAGSADHPLAVINLERLLAHGGLIVEQTT